MKRSIFLNASALALVSPTFAFAFGVSTIVAVNCNVPELDEEAEDILSGKLRDLKVNVVDPSAMDTTYHERARLEVAQLLGGVSVDYSAIAWVTQTYHARRLLVAEARMTSTALPYGQFTVYNVRASCSYRAFDTSSKQIVSAGTMFSIGRAEEERAAQEDALQNAMDQLATHAARRLL